MADDIIGYFNYNGKPPQLNLKSKYIRTVNFVNISVKRDSLCRSRTSYYKLPFHNFYPQVFVHCRR